MWWNYSPHAKKVHTKLQIFNFSIFRDGIDFKLCMMILIAVRYALESEATL